MLRYALVKTIANAEKVAAYLPQNYNVLCETPDGILICGRDNAGWTLDGYVIPRLASGMYSAVELRTREGWE